MEAVQSVVAIVYQYEGKRLVENVVEIVDRYEGQIG